MQTALGAKDFAPPDAFEIAILDANTNQSLTSDPGLTETDSLLNIQNDGTAYFSDKKRIGGATSEDIIDLAIWDYVRYASLTHPTKVITLDQDTHFTSRSAFWKTKAGFGSIDLNADLKKDGNFKSKLGIEFPF